MSYWNFHEQSVNFINFFVYRCLPSAFVQGVCPLQLFKGSLKPIFTYLLTYSVRPGKKADNHLILISTLVNSMTVIVPACYSFYLINLMSALFCFVNMYIINNKIFI